MLFDGEIGKHGRVVRHKRHRVIAIRRGARRRRVVIGRGRRSRTNHASNGIGQFSRIVRIEGDREISPRHRAGLIRLVLDKVGIGVEIVPVNSAREACEGSDFIITATNAPQAVVQADWLEPGQFITGVKDQELEMTGWEKCDQVVVNRHGAFWQRYAIG